MAFALTYDETDLDQLPHKGDLELNRMLIEATNIVRSVHFKDLRVKAAGTPPHKEWLAGINSRGPIGKLRTVTYKVSE